MLSDIFNLPDASSADITVFPANSIAAGGVWSTWRKPKDCSLVYLLTIGGAGSGGGGFTRTAGSAGGGGGGGASGGLSKIIIPALCLPDMLYVSVGFGGNPVAASTAGNAGIQTTINIQQNAGGTMGAVSSAAGGNGGGAGTGSAGGSGGTTGSAVSTTVGALFGIQSITASLAGNGGGAQTGAAGTGVTVYNSPNLFGGAGGAGCTTTDFAGGAVNAITTTIWPNLTVGGAGTGTNGGNGITIPFGEIQKIGFFYPGAGGGSFNSGTAGSGGPGATGSGGGGGGAGTTGGGGGKGGDGLAIIIAI